MRGDLAQTALNAHELSRFAHEHDLPSYRAFGLVFDGPISGAMMKSQI
jgi:hypothetical protein